MYILYIYSSAVAGIYFEIFFPKPIINADLSSLFLKYNFTIFLRGGGEITPPPLFSSSFFFPIYSPFFFSHLFTVNFFPFFGNPYLCSLHQIVANSEKYILLSCPVRKLTSFSCSVLSVSFLALRLRT